METAASEYYFLSPYPLTHTLQWELEYAKTPKPVYVFPEPDLLEKLLQAYRENVHPQLPVLHWPSFLRDIQNGRHYADDGFGMLFLAMCATASRYIDDDRVLIIDTEHHDLSGPSAGWKFIAQTPLIRRSIVSCVETVDLQYYAVSGV